MVHYLISWHYNHLITTTFLYFPSFLPRLPLNWPQCCLSFPSLTDLFTNLQIWSCFTRYHHTCFQGQFLEQTLISLLFSLSIIFPYPNLILWGYQEVSFCGSNCLSNILFTGLFFHHLTLVNHPFSQYRGCSKFFFKISEWLLCWFFFSQLY